MESVIEPAPRLPFILSENRGDKAFLEVAVQPRWLQGYSEECYTAKGLKESLEQVNVSVQESIIRILNGYGVTQWRKPLLSKNITARLQFAKEHQDTRERMATERFHKNKIHVPIKAQASTR